MNLDDLHRRHRNLHCLVSGARGAWHLHAPAAQLLDRYLNEVVMLEGLLVGLQTAMPFQNFAMVGAGCLIGTFIGMLPGLGLMSIIAIMIPIATSMGDPSAALILLAAAYYVAIFGGSTSSILLNAPGVTGTVASSFDGYPMAQQGQIAKAMIMTSMA